MSPQCTLYGALVGALAANVSTRVPKSPMCPQSALRARLHLADLDTSGAVAAYDRAATLAVDARRRSAFGTRASALRARSMKPAKPASSVAPTTRSRE